MYKWEFRAKHFLGTFRKINVIIIKIINEQYKKGEKIKNTLF